MKNQHPYPDETQCHYFAIQAYDWRSGFRSSIILEDRRFVWLGVFVSTNREGKQILGFNLCPELSKTPVPASALEWCDETRATARVSVVHE